MSSQIKLLIIISGNEYIRNYIQNDSLKSLEEEYDCYYIGSEKITLRDQLIAKKNFLGFYPENKEQNQRSFDYFNILMYKYRNKSTSFVFRTFRTFNLPRYGPFKVILTILSQAVRLNFDVLKKYLVKLKVMILSTGLFFSYYKRKYENSCVINQELSDLMDKADPDLVLFPSSAYDPIGVDIVKLSEKRGTPSFFLVDNWDNLSSKSILFEKPDYLGVWSQQSLEHATDIQDFDKSRIHIIGTPRFNQYFQTRDSQMDSFFPFPYILFVGTAVAFDEAGILEKINQVMDENQDIFKGVKLIYRPHPWRQGSDTIAGLDLPHIMIDPQLKNSYLKQDTTTAVQPSLDYYPSLIKNAEFVMGGLTSMLIESLVFRKYYLALAHDDKKNLTSQHNVLKYYVHFRGLEYVDAVNIIHNLDNFADKFKQHWNNRNNVDAQLADKQREYYLSQDAGIQYKDKLRSVVEKILAENAN